MKMKMKIKTPFKWRQVHADQWFYARPGFSLSGFVVKDFDNILWRFASWKNSGESGATHFTEGFTTTLEGAKKLVEIRIAGIDP